MPTTVNSWSSRPSRTEYEMADIEIVCGALKAALESVEPESAPNA